MWGRQGCLLGRYRLLPAIQFLVEDRCFKAHAVIEEVALQPPLDTGHFLRVERTGDESSEGLAVESA